MRILEYTLGLPPFRRGGLPRYSTDLSEELARNNKVYLMYPGQINPYSKKIKLTKKNTKYSFETIEMRNSLPISLGLGIKDEEYYMDKRDISTLKEFIEKIHPDVVHLHTLMGMPKEFLEYLNANKIKTIYTTHDFYGLCPKMLSKDPKNELKSSKCSYDCMLCNVGPSYKKIVIMQSHIYEKFKENKLIKKIRSTNKMKITKEENTVTLSETEVEHRYRLRNYYLSMFNLINEFHFNSSVSKGYINKFLPNAKGKIINITHKGLYDYRNKNCFNSNKIKLGYIGPYDQKKGFFELCTIIKKLRKKYKNFEMHFYGDILNNSIFKEDWVFNHGIIDSNKMGVAYNNIDLLIMPSLWHETFGFSVLEALSYGDICLVSNRVGAKDIVPKDCVFNDKTELLTMLKIILANPSETLNNYQKEVLKEKLPLNFQSHVKEIYNKCYKN